MIVWLRIPFMLAFMAAMGCATVAPYNPFQIPREEFAQKVKVIALGPLSLPKDLEIPDRVKTQFESQIETKLREAGYSVIPAREYAQIHEKLTDQVGGYFDTLTGKVNEEKFKAVRLGAFRELKAKFNTDAVLVPRIAIVKANWNMGTARWWGTTEQIQSTGMQVLEFFAGVRSSGHVGALGLAVAIEDMQGSRLYLNGGGIQVLSKLSAPGKFVPVPRHELFNDEQRNREAVNIALGPLLGKDTSVEPTSREEQP